MLLQAAKLHPELSQYLKQLKLPEGLKEENGRYDGIYSIAALMHLTETDITESLHRIQQLLTPNGIMFISVCIKREEMPTEDQRTFTLKSSEWWTTQIEKTGLKVTAATESTDGLNREKTVWLNITAIEPH